MFIKYIVEYDGALWTEGKISWLSINICSYKGNTVQVIDGEFLPCVSVSPGAEFRSYGCLYSF